MKCLAVSVSVLTSGRQIIERICRAEPGTSPEELLISTPELQEREMALSIADAVVPVARQDVARAERLAAASWLSDLLDDDFCRDRSVEINRRAELQ